MSHRGFAPIVLALLLSLLPSLGMAQATPIANAPSMNPFEIAVPVGNLPLPEADVWLLRYTLEPGGSVPLLHQPGLTLLLVERGEVTLITDGPVTLTNTLSSPQPVAATTPAGATTLGGDQGALVPGDTRLGMTNTTVEQSQVLVLKVFAPEFKRRANIPTGIPTIMPSGVTVQPISHGSASFEGAAGVIVIERTAVDAGQSAVSGIVNGVEVGALERGAARVTCMSGRNGIFPRILTNYNQIALASQVPLNPRATVNLSANDGYLSTEGSLVWRSTSDEPLVVLRAMVYGIDS